MNKPAVAQSHSGGGGGGGGGSTFNDGGGGGGGGGGTNWNGNPLLLVLASNQELD